MQEAAMPELFFGLLVGALLGAFGQCLRLIACVRKQWDEADGKGPDTASKKAAFKDSFDAKAFSFHG